MSFDIELGPRGGVRKIDWLLGHSDGYEWQNMQALSDLQAMRDDELVSLCADHINIAIGNLLEQL